MLTSKKYADTDGSMVAKRAILVPKVSVGIYVGVDNIEMQTNKKLFSSQNTYIGHGNFFMS